MSYDSSKKATVGQARALARRVTSALGGAGGNTLSVEFAASQWSGSGPYTLTLDVDRKDFGITVFQLDGGAFQTGTWACGAVCAWHENGGIVLRSPEKFDGMARIQ